MGSRCAAREPAKLHADKAYDHAELRAWVRERGIAVRIARKGVESSQKLGRDRWVVERSIAWLFGYRRLSIRYERDAGHFDIDSDGALTCRRVGPALRRFHAGGHSLWET